MRLTKEIAAVAIEAADGNLTRAARALGVDRERLRALLGVEERRGRPTKAPTLAAVEAALAEHGSRRAAALALGVSDRTVRRVLATAPKSAPDAELEKNDKRGKKRLALLAARR